MQAWSADRAIRAEVLRHLLVSSQRPMHAKGIRLRGTRISGALDLESTTLRCPLVLEDCYLDSEKPVVLDYAFVSRLELVRCRLAGLTADMLVVTKEMNLTRLTFTGAVNLLGADITGQFICSGAKITGTDADNNALSADGIKVGGAIFLDEEFTAIGAIRLLGADITGDLIGRGAKITGTDTDNNALSADGIKVGGAVFLDGDFTTAGAVCLVGAHIGGPFSLNAEAIRDSSGNPGKLALNGLTYAGLPKHPPVDEWLGILRERTSGYSPQPYRQLAAASQAAGHDALTRKILMAQRRDQLERTDMTWTERMWGQITHVTLGYGYQPWRALLGLLGIVILAVILNVSYGAQGGLAHTKAARAPGTPCSTLEAVGVGLDFATPVVKTGAGETCATTDTSAGNTITISGWVLQFAAWSLATLFVAGFTGAVRKT
jgi:hypothetical protein